MNATKMYSAPLAELLEVEVEGNFLASVEKMTGITGEWDDEDE